METLTLTYEGVYHGDHVHCNYCDKTMLLPIGAGKCPECGAIGCLMWVDDNMQEKDKGDLGEWIINTHRTLKPEDYIKDDDE